MDSLGDAPVVGSSRADQRRAVANPAGRSHARSRAARHSALLIAVSVELIAVSATGLGGAALYAVIILLGIGGGVVGIRRHQERMTWPWWCRDRGPVPDTTASTSDVELCHAGDTTNHTHPVWRS